MSYQDHSRKHRGTGNFSQAGEAPDNNCTFGHVTAIKNRAREVSARLDAKLMKRVKFTPNPNYKGPLQ